MKQIDLTQLKEASFSKIGSVAALNNQLNQIYKILGDAVNDYRVFYRGHSDSSFRAYPSIYRNNPVTGDLYVKDEETYCSGIIRECAAEFEHLSSGFDMLVKMQHYELPTRLLDITENPLVALYFASLEPANKGNNGQILVYFIHKDDIVNYSDLQVSALSSISFIPQHLLGDVKNGRKKIGDLTKNMQIFTSQLPYISKLSDFDKTLCVLPKKSNPRIIRQQGAFFLFGIKDGDKMQMSDLKVEPFILTVSNDSRKSILKHLERYAISEKFLFPEIDNVAHYLKMH